ncbi:galactokinase gal [Macrolepiota fuliginosa MF-IS2]|uniref:Galactokinase n=1 Tax=Macrolepiota fuliginosa MF-IS2 TaxID=1400762 RepID=A0A9P5X8Q4_9AGAR|nr:galactokinase gal [Macrolepiota fuliginosa MF-IS2]
MLLADQPIPVYTNLTDLYGSFGSSLNHAVRWNELTEEFKSRFGRPPTYIVRAPGRVNLIGEHIDYALFGVLPTAVERDILIACAPRPGDSPGSVVAENLNAKYSKQDFAPTTISDGKAEGWHLDIDKKELRWESYVKAGYYGVLSHYFPKSTDKPVPVDMLVTGSVPAGSGLSSSAAMVVASTLTFLAVNNKLEQVQGSEHKPLSKGNLVTMAMENEKRVGVNSGGMDQAASVMSNASSALYITFYPTLSASPLPLPQRALFIITNSLVVSDKAVTAKHRYNLRVVETLVGARVLARALGIKLHDVHGEGHGHGHGHGHNKTKWEKVTYREVLGRFVNEPQGCGPEGDMGPESLIIALKGILTKLNCLLPQRIRGAAARERESEELGVTMEEMIEMSGLSPKVFHEVYLSWVDVEATHFQLYKRAKHVFSESLRVLQFRKICLDAADNLPFRSISNKASTNNEPDRLGQLMNESQKSCSDVFECSCPELDLLTKLCREAGAYGSRLTGAGWGGCAVSLVAEDKAEAFIQKIKETYPPYKDLEGPKLEEVIFATRPSSGACGGFFKFWCRKVD